MLVSIRSWMARSISLSIAPHAMINRPIARSTLGLLRGSIDQVGEVARINWVQPKVLDKSQIVGMRTRLKEWDGSVHRLGTWIEKKGQDVWAA